MAKQVRDVISFHFQQLSDRRRPGSCKYTIHEILTTALCATLANCDCYTAIAEFVEDQLDWFREFLRLEHGAPSDETYRRVLSIIDPEELEIALMLIASDLTGDASFKHIAIDGKALRGSRSPARFLKALHMVSAWCVEQGVVLTQVKVEDKSNEITAIPEVLDFLNLEGTIVSIDAMGCQKNIAAKITEKGGVYLFGLKDNHPKLSEAVQGLFSEADRIGLEASGAQELTAQNKGHGREETRKHTLLPLSRFQLDGADDWANLVAVGRIESKRVTPKSESTESRFFLLAFEDINAFAKAARAHWSIENEQHYVLDVTFNEDASQIVHRRGGENMSILRRVALMLAKRAQKQSKKKISLRSIRRRTSWNVRMLQSVLSMTLPETDPS